MAADVRAAARALGEPQWSIAGPLDHPWVEGLRAAGDAVFPQADGDLGARIEAGLTRAGGGGPALALGMDSPTLPVDALRRAAVSPADLVLGPAFDGGCWCIGWRAARPGLLAGIRWSTGSVLAETVAAARAAGLTVELLPFWYDIDAPQDLDFLRQHLRVLPPEAAAHTRAALRGLEI
jgi:hypothetical protein